MKECSHLFSHMLFALCLFPGSRVRLPTMSCSDTKSSQPEDAWRGWRGSPILLRLVCFLMTPYGPMNCLPKKRNKNKRSESNSFGQKSWQIRLHQIPSPKGSLAPIFRLITKCLAATQQLWSSRHGQGKTRTSRERSSVLTICIILYIIGSPNLIPKMPRCGGTLDLPKTDRHLCSPAVARVVAAQPTPVQFGRETTAKPQKPRSLQSLAAFSSCWFYPLSLANPTEYVPKQTLVSGKPI